MLLHLYPVPVPSLFHLCLCTAPKIISLDIPTAIWIRSSDAPARSCWSTQGHTDVRKESSGVVAVAAVNAKALYTKWRGKMLFQWQKCIGNEDSESASLLGREMRLSSVVSAGSHREHGFSKSLSCSTSIQW